jgi:hypothetical protein
MRSRIAPGHQFPPQIVEEFAQASGYVDHQGKNVEPVLQWDRQRWLDRVKAH